MRFFKELTNIRNTGKPEYGYPCNGKDVQSRFICAEKTHNTD